MMIIYHHKTGKEEKTVHLTNVMNYLQNLNEMKELYLPYCIISIDIIHEKELILKCMV